MEGHKGRVAYVSVYAKRTQIVYILNYNSKQVEKKSDRVRKRFVLSDDSNSGRCVAMIANGTQVFTGSREITLPLRVHSDRESESTTTEGQTDDVGCALARAEQMDCRLKIDDITAHCFCGKCRMGDERVYY